MRHSPEDIRNALENAYTALAPFSDPARWEFDGQLAHLRHALSILAALPADATILDVGCHIGILPLALRMLSYNARGNDKFLFCSREEGKAYGFSEAERTALEKVWAKYGLVIDSADIAKEGANTDANGGINTGATYDVVLSTATIEHQPHPRLFLENIISFAKPGGYLYIATPNGAKLANRIRFLLGRAANANIDEFYRNANQFNGHWREYTLQELARMGTLSGLEIVYATDEQTESTALDFRRGKRLRSLARKLSQHLPGTGDTIMVVFRK